ncbi:hypothetical protein Neosp_014671 [[Neocosmospora] mangrovei]
MALQQLRDQTDCQTCTLFAKTIDYRLRHRSTWAEQHGVWTSGPKQRPLDEEIRDAQVNFKITDSMGTQNWSFGFGGWTHRQVLVARASVGRQGVDIIWQRSGPGGLVPVSRMPAAAQKSHGEQRARDLNSGSGMRIQSQYEQGSIRHSVGFARL